MTANETTRLDKDIEQREKQLAVLMAWESRTISADDACRALGIEKSELLQLEVEAVERGLAYLKAARS